MTPVPNASIGTLINAFSMATSPLLCHRMALQRSIKCVLSLRARVRLPVGHDVAPIPSCLRWYLNAVFSVHEPTLRLLQINDIAGTRAVRRTARSARWAGAARCPARHARRRQTGRRAARPRSRPWWGTARGPPADRQTPRPHRRTRAPRTPARTRSRSRRLRRRACAQVCVHLCCLPTAHSANN